MKNKLRKMGQMLLKPLAERLGYTLRASDQPGNDQMDYFWKLLRALHFEARHIVDIGANHGHWTRRALRFYPDARYSLLEPQFWLEASINDLTATHPNIRFYPVGAGCQTGTFALTIAKDDDSSSFRLSAAAAAELGLEQMSCPVVALASFLEEQKLPVPDILKIDAEGYDLEVLKGAYPLLGQTEVILVEAGIVSVSIDNSLRRVVNFMHDNGYELFDITDINRPFELPVLWLTELAFVRREGTLANAGLFHPAQTRTNVR